MSYQLGNVTAIDNGLIIYNMNSLGLSSVVIVLKWRYATYIPVIEIVYRGRKQ